MAMTEEQKQILIDLGNRVKAIRLAKNLTLKEVAYNINKDPQSISRLEMGGVNPSYLYLLDLCRGLGVSMGELIGK